MSAHGPDPRQFALFDADGAEPVLDDLEGLLLGTGHVTRSEAPGGPLARLSVVVAESWRSTALLAEFEARDVPGEIGTDGRHLGSVRTAFRPELVRLADRWDRRTPLHATAGALRLWALASGRRSEDGFVLRLAPTDPGRWDRSGAALSALGVAGTLVSQRAGGPAYRITGARRLARLRDLLGGRPDAVPPDAWT